MLLVNPAKIQFQSEAATIEIPSANLEIEFEEGGKGLFFFDATQPEIRIYTVDRSILRLSTIRSNRQVAAVLARRELNHSLRLMLYFAAGCALLVWLGSLAVGAMVKAIAAKVPVAWEQKLGHGAMTLLREQHEFIDDTNQTAQLAALAAPLIKVLPAGRSNLTFYISSDPEPNACALPGGAVVVNAGLLKMVEQPEELLGVLAHELAHQTKRHVVRKTIAAAGPLVIFGLFLHSNSGLGNVAAAGSGLMVFQGFSREYETEADDTGWDYLVAANVDPRGMIHMFQKFQDDEAKTLRKPSTPEAFQSHPALEKRIARLEAKWEALPRKSGFVTLPPMHWTVEPVFKP